MAMREKIFRGGPGELAAGGSEALDPSGGLTWGWPGWTVTPGDSIRRGEGGARCGIASSQPQAGPEGPGSVKAVTVTRQPSQVTASRCSELTAPLLRR